MLHLHGLSRYFESAVAGVAAISTLIIAILAGSLPLGEEKTSGTLLWHLTLPVSARRQWFIKLCMALFAGFIGACLVPLFANRFLHLWGGRELFSWLIVLLLLTFAAFWCACAVKGTVPAVLWALPVMIALYFAMELGKWAGPALTNLFFSRFDPFANVKFASAVSSMFGTSRTSRSAFWEFFYNRGYLAPMVLAVLVPLLASVAVTVQLPTVLNVTLKVWVPLLKAALAGKVALASVELIATVSLAVATRFQLASTPLTVTEQAVPAVCAAGLPVMPVLLPGEAVSPGINSCSLAKAAALTVNEEPVLAVMPVLASAMTRLRVRFERPDFAA